MRNKMSSSEFLNVKIQKIIKEMLEEAKEKWADNEQIQVLVKTLETKLQAANSSGLKMVDDYIALIVETYNEITRSFFSKNK